MPSVDSALLLLVESALPIAVLLLVEYALPIAACYSALLLPVESASHFGDICHPIVKSNKLYLFFAFKLYLTIIVKGTSCQF